MNKPILPREVSSSLERKLGRDGFLDYDCENKEIPFPCPVCGESLIITVSGNSHRVDCPQHKTLISARGI